MRLSVIGTGYSGAVHAACLAEIGHEVLGVDTDVNKIELLAHGRAPFFEPGLSEILGRQVASGSLRFTTSLEEAAKFADVHFICVGTPQQIGTAAVDMGQVEAVVEGLGPHLSAHALVVGRSTVPVGTAAQIAARLADLVPTAGNVEVAWNPEFLREGLAVRDSLEPGRIVVGVSSPRADTVLRSVYAALLSAGTPYLSMDVQTAELVKVSANAFLATKISFVNAIADVCDAVGADIVPLTEALGLDDRIGPKFLSAGLGFGGGCLGKDIRGFMARADEIGVGDSVSFLRSVDEINLRRRGRVIELAREFIGGSFEGRNIGILGAAFKPDSDDIRDSPALGVAAAISAAGGRVRVHDPRALDNARVAYPQLEFAAEASKACERADVVLHLTEWREYQELDPDELANVVTERKIIDARNALPLSAWQAAGWTVRALGRPRGAGQAPQP